MAEREAVVAEREAALEALEASLASQRAQATGDLAEAKARVAEANKMADDSILVAVKHQQERKSMAEEVGGSGMRGRRGRDMRGTMATGPSISCRLKHPVLVDH